MSCWENGGVAPIYVCESHAVELGGAAKYSEGVKATATATANAKAPPPVPGNRPAEQPKSSISSGIPSGAPADAQVGKAKQVASPTNDLADVRTAVCDIAPGDSAPKALLNEAIADITPEGPDVYTTAPHGMKSSTATVESEAQRVDPEHICVSRYGQRCSCEAVVHCPKCGRWFCDAHAEEEKWHSCALPM